jgi:hypothetical protein
MRMKLATGKSELAMRNLVVRLSGVCIATIVGIAVQAVWSSTVVAETRSHGLWPSDDNGVTIVTGRSETGASTLCAYSGNEASGTKLVWCPMKTIGQRCP